MKNDLAEKSLHQFNDLMEDCEVNHEDVIIKNFVQSLKDDAREWFSNLFLNFISTWHEFQSVFDE